MAVAQLLRARGNKGELAAAALSDHPERVKSVRVHDTAYEVESVWMHGQNVIFKLAGVDTIDQAEKLAGELVMIPLEERLPLPEGEFYQSDLLGAEVLRREGGVVGVVRNWQEYGGPALLEVETPEGRELLIPFTRAICTEIDVAGKRIVVDLPEGLEEL